MHKDATSALLGVGEIKGTWPPITERRLGKMRGPPPASSQKYHDGSQTLAAAYKSQEQNAIETL